MWWYRDLSADHIGPTHQASVSYLVGRVGELWVNNSRYEKQIETVTNNILLTILGGWGRISLRDPRGGAINLKTLNFIGDFVCLQLHVARSYLC